MGRGAPTTSIGHWVAVAILYCVLWLTPWAAQAADAKAPVRVGDEVQFSLERPRGEDSPERRAAHASRVLEDAARNREGGEVRWEPVGAEGFIYVGNTLVVRITQADAEAAGSASVRAHAELVTARLRVALRGERRRAEIARTVFSVAMVVFLGLIAGIFASRLRRSMSRAKDWIERNHKILTVRFQRVELLDTEMVRSALLTLLGGLGWVARLGLGYAWLVVSFSLFDATKHYTPILTGFLVSPVSALMSRLAASLPIFVLVLLVAGCVGLGVRFIALLFSSVERGETSLSWLRPEHASPTSALLRLGLVIAAFVFIGPLVTGNPSSSFLDAGLIALGALGLAATPLVAGGAVGCAVIWSGELRKGERIEVGGRTGRVQAVTLLKTYLIDDDGAGRSVPHLVLLWSTWRHLPAAPSARWELRIQPEQAAGLAAQVREWMANVRVELVAATPSEHCYALEMAAPQAEVEVLLGRLTQIPGFIAMRRAST